MRISVAILLGLTLFGLSASAADRQFLARPNQPVPDAESVQKTALQFIEAFTKLDWERFRSFFAEDATVFFPPSAQSPNRANGKAEIEKVFHAVFEAARKRKPSPPYLVIEPKNLKVQMLGEVAIVTFHLEDPDLFGRRTVVFERKEKKWLIVHLHASGVPK